MYPEEYYKLKEVNGITNCFGRLGCGKTTHAFEMVNEAVNQGKSVCVVHRFGEYDRFIGTNVTVLQDLDKEKILSLAPEVLLIDNDGVTDFQDSMTLKMLMELAAQVRKVVVVSVRELSMPQEQLIH